jgi:putative tricarboxylic transport membrane protein
MESKKVPNRPRGGGFTHSHADALGAIAVLAIGIVMMVDNSKLGVGWAVDGPEGGYFPFRVGAILCIAAAAVLFKSLFGRERRRAVFVTWERLRLVLMVLVPTVLYVLATQFVGIYVASAIFIAAFMRVMDKRGWLKVMLISFGVSASLFWLFEIQFRVPLPKGPLEALLGY